MDRKLAGFGFIYDTATGALVSSAPIVVDPLPAGLAMIERATDLNPDTERWDAKTHTVVPFVNADKIAALNAARATIAAQITALGGVVAP